MTVDREAMGAVSFVATVLVTIVVVKRLLIPITGALSTFFDFFCMPFSGSSTFVCLPYPCLRNCPCIFQVRCPAHRIRIRISPVWIQIGIVVVFAVELLAAKSIVMVSTCQGKGACLVMVVVPHRCSRRHRCRCCSSTHSWFETSAREHSGVQRTAVQCTPTAATQSPARHGTPGLYHWFGCDTVQYSTVHPPTQPGQQASKHATRLRSFARNARQPSLEGWIGHRFLLPTLPRGDGLELAVGCCWLAVGCWLSNYYY